MERTIKFRAKDLQGNWVYGGITSLSHTHDGKTYIISSVGYEGQEEKEKIELIEVIPETVGQFTGLLDKNGLEIWEGDNLKIEIEDEDSLSETFEFFGTVIYGRDCKHTKKQFVTDYPSSFTIYCKEWYKEEGLLGNSRHDLKVIGNIHEQ